MPDGDGAHSDREPAGTADGTADGTAEGAGDGDAPTPHARRPPGRRLRRLTGGLVALVLLAAGSSYQFDLGPRWFGFDYPSPVTEPDRVPPPPGLTLPEPADATPVSEAVRPPAADADAVRRAVARFVRRPRLGPEVAVAVTGLADGEPLYRTGPDRTTPASTLKLLTGAAALVALGPEHRFRTRVVSDRPGRITLVGGGDPLLERTAGASGGDYPQRADLATMARGTARALRERGVSRVRLRYDASLFDGPAVSPDWEASYVPDNVVSPVRALWVDEGRAAGGAVRSADPAADAARAFARELRRRDIRVRATPVERTASAAATELADVDSAPLAQIVQHVLEVSDNEGAEVLARHVTRATGAPAAFSSIGSAYRSVLTDVDVDTSGDRVLDGSGLARGSRVSPETLLSLIRVAAGPDHPELRPLLTGLPVAGFSGSLAYRFETGDPQGLGAVRAKTGTLTGVHALAGTVTTRDGVVLAFVASADRVKVVNSLPARAILDELAAALAGCTCAA